MKLSILSPVILATFFSCSPKVVTNSFNNISTSRIGLEYEPFAIIESDTIDRSNHKLLGQIEIKDTGLSINCSYETIISLAKSEALKIGGNSIVVTKHRKPNQWSTCHRIKADVLYIKDVKKYEKEILWNQNRKLEISDFKGSIEKRPFTAATMSSFRYQIKGNTVFPNRYKIFVETYFDCNSSYFKNSEHDSLILEHEQLHFDISELYARKYLKRIKEEAKNLNELLEKKDKILDEVGKELILRQDEYDTEVYADRTKQNDWNVLIHGELSKLNEYSTKILIVKKKK